MTQQAAAKHTLPRRPCTRTCTHRSLASTPSLPCAASSQGDRPQRRRHQSPRVPRPGVLHLGRQLRVASLFARSETPAWIASVSRGKPCRASWLTCAIDRPASTTPGSGDWTLGRQRCYVRSARWPRRRVRRHEAPVRVPSSVYTAGPRRRLPIRKPSGWSGW